ncbi:MFS general substrate transporter [Hypoxylon sp. FL1150]|nr:MFS general substrate transporter [Hypoxylon sp. FL1150]
MSSTDSGASPTRGPAVFAVTTATLVLATCIVAARLFCRIRIVRSVTWDDYAIVTAWIIALALSFSIDFGVSKGLGRHDDDIAFEDWYALRRCEYAFSVLYNPALMATKTSVLIFYLRLSKNTQKVLRLASWAVLAIVNVAGTVLTLINIFQCRPVGAAFDPYDGSSFCIPLLTEFICSAPVNVVTDLAILALPLPVLTGMRLPRRQKVILVFTFALGIFVTVVDVVRIYYLEQAITQVSVSVSDDPEATFGDSSEFAWNASLSLMWSAVEVNVGMICACIPTLKPLIRRILPAMLVDPNATRTYDKDTSTDGNGSSSNGRPPTAGIVPEGHLRPPPRAHSGDRRESEVSAIDFITTPDMVLNPVLNSPPADPLDRTATMLTSATGYSAAENSVYFGFVNMRRPKSMIRTSVRDSFKYCTVVTILFLLWGFSYGLLNQLNNAVATVSGMSTAETIGLSSVYFGGGYFVGPLLVGEWILRHDEHSRSRKKKNGPEQIGGYRATFIVGLCFYGVGTIMFWPSAVLTSFAGFMICNFVVGFGLAIIETGANPFLVFCGPMDYAEMRLCLAQGIQAIATVLSGLLAQKVFFTALDTSNDISSLVLLDVQWTYLAVTLLCVVLALFFYYMPLPEVTDAEMEHSTRYLPIDPKKRSFGGLELRTWTLTLAVLAQWTYVAGQESMSIFFSDILTPKTPVQPASNSYVVDNAATESLEPPPGLALSIPNYLLISHAAFALSRFLTAYLAFLSPTNPKVPQPRTVLSITTGLSIICGILVTALRPANPNLLAIPIVLFFFFEGPMWPLIFTLGLRGQGKRTKRAAAWITMGASGPAFWPFVMYAIVQRGGSIQTAYSLVPALLFVTGFFSLFLDLKRDARALVDARVGAEDQSRIQDRANRDMDLDDILAARRRASVIGLPIDVEKMSFLKRFSVALSKGSSVLPGPRSSDSPATEHREANSGSPG